MSNDKPVSFGRRVRQSGRLLQESEVKEETTGEERKEAEEDGITHKSGTAWQISMELTAEEQQHIKQSTEKAERDRQMTQQRREARAGRRAKRSTAPAATTSVSSSAVDSTSTTAAVAAAGRRQRPRRHTANDAVSSHTPPTASTLPTAATAATAAAAAEVVSHSLDDLQRSWDDLDQFLATELASLSSTAATRKHTRLSVTHDTASTAGTGIPAKLGSVSGEGGDEEDVDAIIDEFLASTSTSSSTALHTSRRTATQPPTAQLPVLPVLPAGSELTLRVRSVWSGRTSSMDVANVRRVECYNDAGSLIHTVPLPASTSPQPTASFSFPSRQRVSLVRLFNSGGAVCSVREVELSLDNRLIFCGELVADGCESLLFTRDEVLIGRLLRTMHSSGVDAADSKRRQRPAMRHTASVEGEKRVVVRVWRDGVETLCTPSTTKR